uniref:Uncharacterized protein n=1 Tax=Acrobeloides nanus TaxID=290746 RepID=A0A914ECH7_9BILA
MTRKGESVSLVGNECDSLFFCALRKTPDEQTQGNGGKRKETYNQRPQPAAEYPHSSSLEDLHFLLFFLPSVQHR